MDVVFEQDIFEVLEATKDDFLEEDFLFYKRVLEQLEHKPLKIYRSDIKPFLELQYDSIIGGISMYCFLSSKILKVVLIDDKTNKLINKSDFYIKNEEEALKIIEKTIEELEKN